jgi:hypothetical protein
LVQVASQFPVAPQAKPPQLFTLQQTALPWPPSMQFPLAHSTLSVHDAPTGSCPTHWPVFGPGFWQ